MNTHHIFLSRCSGWLSSVAVLAVLCTPAPTQERTVAIRNARVLTMTGAEIEGATVLLRGGKIVEVGADVEIPAGAEITEASGGTLMPGLVHAYSRAGLSERAGGHTDPHSGLGMGALGGFLAAKAVMQARGIQGTLRFFGEPAEKVRGSKPIHAAAGYYDGLDAMISFHPFYMLPLCNTVRWDTHCATCYSLVYRFTCPEPETWLAGTADAPIPQAHASGACFVATRGTSIR